jgi:hypothetical protein
MDRYTQLVNTSVGSAIVSRWDCRSLAEAVGARDEGHRGKVLVGGAPSGRLAVPLARVLADVVPMSPRRCAPTCARPPPRSGLDAAP